MLDNLSGVMVLLGSGTSIPSKCPSTAQITQSLLSDNWLYKRDQSRFPVSLFSPVSNQVYPLRVEAIMGLVRVLRSYVDQHLALHGKGEATYEDIYYLARQLLDSFRGEYDNPALLPLMFDVRQKTSLMIEKLNYAYGLDGIGRRKETLGPEWLLEQTLDFIEECVEAQLVLPGPVVGLDLLDQLLANDPQHPLNVTTLNHDTLIESHLASNGIADGFTPLSKDVEIFDPAVFENPGDSRIHLLKLHGSVNWFRYNTSAELLLKVTSGERDHVKGRNGEDLGVPTGRLLLAGTTNKELAYGSGIFLELMFQFHRRLKQTQLLVVSGYGFGDKGINNRIWAWLDSRPENRLMILHEQIDELRRNAKPSLTFNMTRHKEARKIAIVDRWLCNCSLDDLKRDARLSFGMV